MASVRRLKKDIVELTAQLIGDCIDYVEYFDNADEEKAIAIISDAVKMHNEAIDRANHPDGKDNPKLVKAHYNKLQEDFVKGIDDAYAELEKLVKE
ncbi:hypothetical protein [Prolixibacter sp. SD074]|jgi:urocanate hydratase|uniref:hypothetical protein n=1 Tax=Prolixibacter sp. SD074 TaxID=2652391 RepID=UPI001281C579|nr:hypothetical protein [Prolixibacter sp. SD074]GET30332.1 hypothetical protein SD074_25340 [Prolixibacter sp. SD074]